MKKWLILVFSSIKTYNLYWAESSLFLTFWKKNVSRIKTNNIETEREREKEKSKIFKIEQKIVRPKNKYIYMIILVKKGVFNENYWI